MNLFMVLFAVDFGNIVQVLILAVVALLWLISYLKKLVGGQRPGQNPRTSQPSPVPQFGQPDETEEADMDDEVSDFLRRAAQRRGTPEHQAEHTSLSQLPSAFDEEVVDVEIVDDGPFDGTVSEHVDQHPGAGAFAERSSDMGDRVAVADDVMDSRMHHKFDHTLGSLKKEDIIEDISPIAEGRPGAQVGKAVALGEIAALMGDRQSLRAALVFSEIIQRPEHRW